MLERQLEAALRREVTMLGGVAYKLDARAHKGAPDRVVVLPGRGVTFVELKTETGKLSPLQIVESERIRAAGGRAVVLRGLDELRGWLDA